MSRVSSVSDCAGVTIEGYRTPLPDLEPLASQPFAQLGARQTGVEPAIQTEIENPCSEIQPDSTTGKVQFQYIAGKVSQGHLSVADHSPASQAEKSTVLHIN